MVSVSVISRVTPMSSCSRRCGMIAKASEVKLKDGHLGRLHICNGIHSYGHDPLSSARKKDVKGHNETI